MKKVFRNLGKASLDAVINALVAFFMIMPTIVSVLAICLNYVAKFFLTIIKSQKAIIHFLTSKTIFSNGKDYVTESLQ